MLEKPESPRINVESLLDEVTLKPNLKNKEFPRAPRNTNGAICAKVLSWKGHEGNRRLKMRWKMVQNKLGKGKRSQIVGVLNCITVSWVVRSCPKGLTRGLMWTDVDFRMITSPTVWRQLSRPVMDTNSWVRRPFLKLSRWSWWRWRVGQLWKEVDILENYFTDGIDRLCRLGLGERKRKCLWKTPDT